MFFAIPLVNQLNVSLQTGDPETGYTFTWAFSTYTDAISEYGEQFMRSIGYAATATVLCLVIAFPLAYFIAFKAGRWKNFMLLLIILPFFVSYVLRTVSWQLILADDGFVVDTLKTRRAGGRRRAAAGHAHGGDRRASPTTSCPSWRCRSTCRSRRSTSG